MAVTVRLTSLSKSLSALSLRQSTTLTSYGGSIITRSLCLHSSPQSSISYPSVIKTQLLQTSEPRKNATRCTSFFAKLPAEQLWKGVTSVSNAGKKRGRGKGIGKKMSKDLNRGQIIGVGQENIVWPGLNAPIIRGKELVHQQHLPKDEEREAKLLKLRDNMGVFRPLRLAPQERGWTGSKMPGRSIGPPDPIGEDTFEGFDTKVLELKTVTNMSGIFGRKRRMSVFAVTGNGNGLAGFSLAKANALPAALRKARNGAGQKLMYIERYNGHTVFHDFYSQFAYTKLFVKKMPEGYGLVCHRAIKTICEIIGIKDLYAKVEGTTNIQNLTKAFFLGLLNQKSHQQLADKKGLHLVEFREETRNFPNVVASPLSGVVRAEDEISPDEELDYRLYTMDGKVELQRRKFAPFYHSKPGYEVYLKKYQTYRNREDVIRTMLSEQGEVKSFLADQYPECVMGGLRPQKEIEADADDDY